MPEVTLVKGDATERWPLPDNSLDSIVTDPPYGIAFMSKNWDDKGGPQAYQEWSTKWAREAFRCLKPGGFLLAFGATRMAHRMTCGFEDAGFEILDTIEWLYLSGMPKAQDIGKMFDKAVGAQRTEVIGVYEHPDGKPRNWGEHDPDAIGYAGGYSGSSRERHAPVTDLAKQWDGWKTPSLKPAHEPIVVARKPLIGTYCENIEQWGVGAINVDGCRVPGTPEATRFDPAKHSHEGWRFDATGAETAKEAAGKGGRFPANVVISHGPDCTEEACQDGCPVAVLDAQSGILTSGKMRAGVERKNRGGYAGPQPTTTLNETIGDTGGASKVFAKFFFDEEDFAPFYYCPKASSSERHAGLEHPGTQFEHGATLRKIENGLQGKGNFHPTVKPKALMCYLQRLVTPPGGMTGSPFLGSGTDAVAAIAEGFAFWGMNLPDRPDEVYWPIIEARVAHALTEAGKPKGERKAKAKETTAPPDLPGQVRFSFEGVTPL